MRKSAWLRAIALVLSFTLAVPVAYATDTSAEPATEPTAAATVPADLESQDSSLTTQVPEPAAQEPSDDKSLAPLDSQEEGTAVSTTDDYYPGDPLPASPLIGQLERYVDDNDYYKVWLNAGDTLELTLDVPSTADFDLYLYNSDAQLVGYSIYYNPEYLKYTAVKTGFHSVRMHAYSGYGQYTLQWVKTPRPPAAQCSVQFQASDSVEWNKPVSLWVRYTEDQYTVAGKPIYIEYKAFGSTTWRTVRTLYTASSGEQSGSILATAKGNYRARTVFNGKPVYSALQWVTVYPYMTLKSSSSVKLGSDFTVQGYLGPKHTTGAKHVVLKFYQGGKLRKTVKAKNYAYTTKSGLNITKYKATVSLSKPGRWKIKASVTDEKRHSKRTVTKYVYVNKTRLSIRNNNVDVTYSRSAKLGGTLRNRSGKPLAGKTVKLQYYKDGAWRTAKKLKTNSKGNVSAEVQPKESRFYRLRFSGDSSQASSTSDWTYVYSCYAVREGYCSYEYGWWGSPVWLSKGTHQIKAYAREGLDQVYIQDYDRTWGKKVNTKRLPGSKWRVYYFKAPKSGWYLLGWKGNWAYRNYIKFKVW